jgi:hypothetical protein
MSVDTERDQPSSVNRKMLWAPGLALGVLGVVSLLALGGELWKMDLPGHAPYGAVSLALLFITAAIGAVLVLCSLNEKIKATPHARAACALMGILLVLGGVLLLEVSRPIGLAVSSLGAGPALYGIAPLFAAFR